MGEDFWKFRVYKNLDYEYYILSIVVGQICNNSKVQIMPKNLKRKTEKQKKSIDLLPISDESLLII